MARKRAQNRGWFRRHAPAWLSALALFLAAAIIFGVLFIRRDTSSTILTTNSPLKTQSSFLPPMP